MATFTRSDELHGAQFIDADLRGARFVRADLSGVVMREVTVDGADIDAPWLTNGSGFLRINGVDVVPLVEAELNRRFPGRSERRAADPDSLRAAWAALEHTWAATLDRVAAMPADTVDISVDGEWSFAQTLRHLVLATDLWLGKAVLELEKPFHPLGLESGDDAGPDSSRPSPLRTPKCLRRGRVASRWCATSSPPSPPTSWPRSVRTHTPPNTRRPPSPACT